MEREALGLIECRGLVAMIEAAGDTGKAANCRLVGWEKINTGLAPRTVGGEGGAGTDAPGGTPPLATADRTYTGKFMVRVPPEGHRQLALEASEQNVSLNRLAASRLIGA